MEKINSIKKKKRNELLVILGVDVVFISLITIFIQYVSPKYLDIPLISWVYWRNDMILTIYIIISFTAIFLHFWDKPWKYIDEIICATEQISNNAENTSFGLPTDLVEIEELLNHIKMSLILNAQRAKDEENKKNELIIYLAHDIRTPLTTVIGYLSLLDETPNIPNEQKGKYINIALTKAERLQELLDELFEITRYNLQAVSLEKEEINLSYLIAQVADEFYPLLSEKGNEIKVLTDDDLVIFADPEKLVRVFSNLIKNAINYSHLNTDICIFAKKEHDKVFVDFKNVGETIPQEKLEKMFEKFYRLDKARISDTGGTGLGLSIAKEIVRLHNGEIYANSKNGTITITVVLPVS